MYCNTHKGVSKAQKQSKVKVMCSSTSCSTNLYFFIRYGTANHFNLEAKNIAF